MQPFFFSEDYGHTYSLQRRKKASRKLQADAHFRYGEKNNFLISQKGEEDVENKFKVELKT